ncbi:MAG: ATPase domain-containing protein [Candidatus Micrarchaeota archaeon]
MEKIKSGLDGLDELLSGGIPHKHNVLICGGPGTGKTTLCMQFLYGGAKLGEKGMFISLEEDPLAIVENIKSTYSWEGFEEHIKNKDIVVASVEKFNFEHFMDVVQDLVTDKGLKRVVIDSSTLLKIYFKEPLEFRKNLFNLVGFLKRFNCTTLITAEFPSMERKGTLFELEHFVSDGIVFLYNLEKGNLRMRAIEVIKMRACDHMSKVVPFKMTKTGVVVFPKEQVFSETTFR